MTLLPEPANSLLVKLAIAAVGATFLYALLFYGLRLWFRQFERDVALVTLNISRMPLLVLFLLVSARVTVRDLDQLYSVAWLEPTVEAAIVITISYWMTQLFSRVVAYYLKNLAQQNEVMWDDVLVPLLEGVIPIAIYILGLFFVLQRFGLDLTGFWVTLGGASFILGFATKDILANFFSGLVLLIDTPFQFGDIVSLNDGSTAMIQKIGVRVTQLYVFDNHCEVYIPNSVLQGQQIANLSRPTTHYYYAVCIPLRIDYDGEEAEQVMRSVVLGHPDILGNLDEKLECIENFNYLRKDEGRTSKLRMGRLRLIAEKQVNSKLEEIEQALEAMYVTLQFLQKAGMNEEERQTVREEYSGVMSLIGFEALPDRSARRAGYRLEEAKSPDALTDLVRNWYRAWLKDPDLLSEDQYGLPEEWERKIELLRRRVYRLYQKISGQAADETRLSDDVLQLIRWFRDEFKQSRNKWQEPLVLLSDVTHDEGFTYTEFTIKFYIDDIKLEHCRRGDRVSSEVRREIARQLEAGFWKGEPPQKS